ncbi:hypothetical protein SBADM41S_09760 [Streptomyces badius]
MPLCTKVVASRENVFSGRLILPFSLQAPVSGLAALDSRTYGRIAQGSSAGAAAK